MAIVVFAGQGNKQQRFFHSMIFFDIDNRHSRYSTMPCSCYSYSFFFGLYNVETYFFANFLPGRLQECSSFEVHGSVLCTRLRRVEVRQTTSLHSLPSRNCRFFRTIQFCFRSAYVANRRNHARKDFRPWPNMPSSIRKNCRENSATDHALI